jgi:hypothetical protein
MKRSRRTYVIVAVLLFAVWSIPTSSFGLSANLERSRTYYVDGQVVGAEVENACWGGVDWWWGQLGGELMKEQYTYCDNSGPSRCNWYSWNGSEWVLILSGDCNPDGELPPRDRPLR